jgi:hypothetical protein
VEVENHVLGIRASHAFQQFACRRFDLPFFQVMKVCCGLEEENLARSLTLKDSGRQAHPRSSPRRLNGATPFSWQGGSKAKKADVVEYRGRYSTTSAYSSTSPPGRWGLPFV